MFVKKTIHHKKGVFSEEIEKWSEAHVSYNKLRQNLSSSASRTMQLEHEWRRKIASKTPNGKLIFENSLLENFKKSSIIHLLHITPNLYEILVSRSLYASSGCLVGGVYTSPLFEKNGEFRMHNLGRYIFEKEAPRASYLQKRKNPDTLIIEIALPPSENHHLVGIDYTRLGNVHLQIYRELESLLSSQEKKKLHYNILNKIRKSSEILELVNNFYADGQKIEPGLFFKTYIDAIANFPILGYFYFEVVSEYLMLYQDSNEAKKAHSVGELYNHSYKDLMFDLFPDLLLGQGLNIFKPTLKELSSYVEQKGIISNFNQNEMSNYLANRLAFLIYVRLMNADSSFTGWRAPNLNFDTITNAVPQLIGHLLHRELKKPNRNSDFDQLEALRAWSYWNHMNIVVPFNGFMPKGESGINPAYQKLDYRIYSGKAHERENDLYLTKGKELNIKIISRLVHTKYATMRI